MKTHTFKAVGYAYATSPFATKHGFAKAGCYYTETFTHLGKGKIHKVSATIDRAYEHAATLPQSFHWSDIRTHEAARAKA